MACTCVKEYETIGNTIIGRTTTICQECIDVSAVLIVQKAKDDEIAEKKAYLTSTDYMILRQTEQSTLSTQDFDALKALRQAARVRINELQA